MKLWTMVIIAAILMMVMVFIDNSWALIALLFENFKSVTIHEWSNSYPEDHKTEIRKEIIPRIIHQTWKNETIPEKWLKAYNHCKKLHPDYKHILWTDEKARNFIAQEYPWFLHQYDKYPYPIQRVDSLRYFILVHYGGIYIDLDIECLRPLDPLLSYSAWLRTTTPTGISNDVMGSVPYHPFFLYVINRLKFVSKNWIFPYITVMATTGPLFLSVMLEKYMFFLPSNAIIEEYVRIVTFDISNQTFKDFHGSTWHCKDAKFFLWVSNSISNLSFQDSSFSLKKPKKNTSLPSLLPNSYEKDGDFKPNNLDLEDLSNKCTYKEQHIYKKKLPINAFQKNRYQLKHVDSDNWINDDVNKYHDEEFDFQGNLGRFDKQKVFSEIRKSNMISSTLASAPKNCLSKAELPNDVDISNFSCKKKSSLIENNYSFPKVNRNENKVNNDFLSNYTPSGDYDKNYAYQQKTSNQHFSGHQSLSSIDKINRKVKKLRNIKNNLECPCIKSIKMAEAEYISILDTGISNEIIIENAARGISFLTTQLLDDFFNSNKNKIVLFNIIILVGNNQTGMYAIAAGRHLCSHGIKIMAVVVDDNPKKKMLASLQSFSDVGGKVVSIDELFKTVKTLQPPPGLIIDAVCGCHCSLTDIVDNNIRNKIHSLIEWANQYESSILSLDLPCGLDITTGTPIVPSCFLKSKWILSLGLPKTGLLFALRSKYVTKELFLADIGISWKVWKKVGVGKRVKTLWTGQDWIIKMGFS
ncbi:hypothetical protein PORY_001986 [Pneumocystis oryctolagi]|uniref:Uncharacterized protein n=1 Tax=Pneumocystis oryctolagi TaxID=42067 RepID=A0ACB7CCD0_9ASCO|nr:hypothetical protein PORY_001986 [Pneumocystis oryctolagi]